MRLTLRVFEFVRSGNPMNSTWLERNPRGLRGPWQGRQPKTKSEIKHAKWNLSMGEHDVEMEVVDGYERPIKEMIPQIIVPDLSECKYKPYVSYRVEEFHEPPCQAKDLFDLFYAPEIEAEIKGTQLEELPKEEDTLTNKIFKRFRRRL